MLRIELFQLMFYKKFNFSQIWKSRDVLFSLTPTPSKLAESEYTNIRSYFGLNAVNQERTQSTGIKIMFNEDRAQTIREMENALQSPDPVQSLEN
jgi:hypothetical protein